DPPPRPIHTEFSRAMGFPSGRKPRLRTEPCSTVPTSADPTPRRVPSMSQVLEAPAPRQTAGVSFTLGPTLTLFLISVVGLFLELMLIRWVSTEIRIFAYLQNTVLVVCFLGLGMGCWDCRKPFALRHLLLPLLVLVALLGIPTTRNFLGVTITDML